MFDKLGFGAGQVSVQVQLLALPIAVTLAKEVKTLGFCVLIHKRGPSLLGY